MGLTPAQKEYAEQLLEGIIRKKIESHNPEAKNMPFHNLLFNKERMTTYSFVHSICTSLGMSFFEEIAATFAIETNRFKEVKKRIKLKNKISKGAQAVIQEIIDELSVKQNTVTSNKFDELKRIKEVCQQGKITKTKPSRIDLYLEDKNNKIYLIDLKTAKPNKDGFTEIKRRLLTWAAIILYDTPNANICSLIAIPYNPYEGKKYESWTMGKLFDSNEELKVGAEFWDFVGPKGTYDDLLGCFERVGKKMRREINTHLKKLAESKQS